MHFPPLPSNLVRLVRWRGMVVVTAGRRTKRVSCGTTLLTPCPDGSALDVHCADAISTQSVSCSQSASCAQSATCSQPHVHSRYSNTVQVNADQIQECLRFETRITSSTTMLRSPARRITGLSKAAFRRPPPDSFRRLCQPEWTAGRRHVFWNFCFTPGQS